MGRGFVTVMGALGLLTGCDARSLVPDAGGTSGTGSGGSGGSDAGPIVETWPQLELSDFEDLAAATIVQTGTPPRNGYWYTYNDELDTCVQLPAPSRAYLGEVPPTPSPGPSGSLALHARWDDCDYWGAGIGADINVPISNGGTYSGPKVPYDVSPYSGITFWALATPGSQTELRVKFPMTDETAIVDGGNCTDTSTNKCSDNFGEYFTLPTDGNWKQVTVRFSDRAFMQEGWGAAFPWNPGHVTSIQIQARNRNLGVSYDFWIDDMYLIQ